MRMLGQVVFRAVSPYLGAGGVLLLLIVLLAAIYFTWLELQWLAFLGGVLMAAVFSMVGRASRAEHGISRRTAQLVVAHQRLATEISARERADGALASARQSLRFIESMPVMIACFDAGQQLRYCNRAFADWMGNPAEGRTLAQLLGEKEYAEVRAPVQEALAGRLVRFERTRRMPDQSIYRLAIQYVPHFGEAGAVLGFYSLLNDITERARPAEVPRPQGEARDGSEQAAYGDSMAEQLTGWDNVADRLIAALEHDEFCLYRQAIVPLAAPAGAPPFAEILVRLNEEEQNLMPPGAFLPLAEQHGLMPDLDRWVVAHLLEWVSRDPARAEGSYSVNVSGATIADPAFPAFVREELRRRGLPGKVLCAEFSEGDAAPREADAEHLVRQLRESGCRSILSGFGHSELSFRLLRRLRLDMIKIDGSIVLKMLRDRVELARVTAIVKVARLTGVQTIAELVESEETIAKLREIGVNYAQGFGISRPRPIDEPD